MLTMSCTLESMHGACAPSPPLGGEGRGEGVSPRVATSRFAETPPHPDLLSRRSGLPDLRIITAEVGQARLRIGGEGAHALCSPRMCSW